MGFLIFFSFYFSNMLVVNTAEIYFDAKYCLRSL